MTLQEAVPLRWPSGPIEITHREKQGTLTPQARQILERWHNPAALDILKGTPVDCLVLSWAAGFPEDARQQKTAAPLLEAARQRGLAVVGWVEGRAVPTRWRPLQPASRPAFPPSPSRISKATPAFR
jgi:hypothetical protein